MKTLVLSILALFILTVSNAGNNESKIETKSESNLSITPSVELNGSITDFNSSETLVGVEVQIEGTNLKTYTDFDGNFSFENIIPGNYKIVASYISYEKNTVNIDATTLDSDKNINIKMATSN